MKNITITTPTDNNILKYIILIGILSNKPTIVKDVVLTNDTIELINILVSMGGIINIKENNIYISGSGIYSLNIPDKINIINNKDVLSILITLLVNMKEETTITVDKKIFDSEIKDLINILNENGASIDYNISEIININIIPSIINPIHISNIYNSSIIKYSLLITGLFAENNTTIIEETPTSDHVERLLSFFSNNIHKTPTFNKMEMLITEHKPKSFNSVQTDIPSDISLSIAILSLGLLGRFDNVSVNNVSINPTSNKILEFLHDSGAEISATNIKPTSNIGEPSATLTSSVSSLYGIDIVDTTLLNNLDIVILSFILAFAKGETRIYGVHKLRLNNEDLLNEILSFHKNIGVKSKVEVYEKDNISQYDNLELADKYEEVLVIQGNYKLLDNKNVQIKHFETSSAIIALISELTRIIFHKDFSYKYKSLIDTIYPEFYNILFV